MPLIFDSIADGPQPRFACDYCTQNIEDGRMAIVLYEPDAFNHHAIYLHKGECDTAWQRNNPGMVYHWMDVTDLVQLLQREYCPATEDNTTQTPDDN